MKILLFHGRGFISAAIRWQSRGDYSHAAVLLEDPDLHPGDIIESWQGAGVRATTITDWRRIDTYAVEGLTQDEAATAQAWLRDKIGMPYDYGAVLRFLSRRKAGANGKYFCSELAFLAMTYAGHDLLRRIPAHNVSPGHLATSPRLIYVPRCEECGIDLTTTRRAYAEIGSKRPGSIGRPICIECRPRTELDPEPIDLVAYEKHYLEAIARASTPQDFRNIDLALMRDHHAIPNEVIDRIDQAKLKAMRNRLR